MSEVDERPTKRLKAEGSDHQLQESSAPSDGRSTIDHPPSAPAAPQEAPNGNEPSSTSIPSNDKTPATNGLQETRDDSRTDNRTYGVAPVKVEYLIPTSALNSEDSHFIDYDAAEAGDEPSDKRGGRGGRDKKKGRGGGQNTNRSFGRSADAIQLCNSVALHSEFSSQPCQFGEKCRLSHNLREYLEQGRREDVESNFGGVCPVFEAYGRCPSGWKCRFMKSHMEEIERDDGRKELILVEKSAPWVSQESRFEDTTNNIIRLRKEDQPLDGAPDAAEAATETTPRVQQEKEEPRRPGPEEELDARPGVLNLVPNNLKMDLSRKRVQFALADEYIAWSNKEADMAQAFFHRRKNAQENEDRDESRAAFVDPPFKPAEKRSLYFGPETPVLAPLTTQGNLPFRRMCVELGAELTYSEMIMGFPFIHGAKNDWTLLRAHESEMQPPNVNKTSVPVVDTYDNSRDIRFAAQLSANAPWVAMKSANLISRYTPRLRLIDLNCGCPIDMVYKSGAGAGLLEMPAKMVRLIRGMNAVSGEIPITAKLRMGVKASRPIATSVIEKIAFGSPENRDRLGAPGCAAITLHGRSREQRYTRRADWSYIAECAAMVKAYNKRRDEITDTIAEPDASTLPSARDGKMYFIGNGDCYSHVDYYEHIEKAQVDTVMIGRGAIIKPWVFEEIKAGQYLDKSATERLSYVEKFARYGLEAWGSDEVGIGYTRRFLLEWLSFTHRYVPIGLLEYLPPNLNDRPPAFRGRNELETLLASPNYKDWIKISEMYLGPAHPDFKFVPKHKSNAYETEG